RRVPIGVNALASGFETKNPHGFVIEKRIKQPDRVRTATNASRYSCWQLTIITQHLLSGFFTNDFLQIPHHRGERMRSSRGTENIVGGINVGDPVAKSFIDRVFQST